MHRGLPGGMVSVLSIVPPSLTRTNVMLARLGMLAQAGQT
jgi:hypothetical protein